MEIDEDNQGSLNRASGFPYDVKLDCVHCIMQRASRADALLPDDDGQVLNRGADQTRSVAAGRGVTCAASDDAW